jgi:hypothetical protein
LELLINVVQNYTVFDLVEIKISNSRKPLVIDDFAKEIESYPYMYIKILLQNLGASIFYLTM